MTHKLAYKKPEISIHRFTWIMEPIEELLAREPYRML